MTEFFAMGGYGMYVWGSFGMCIVVMTVEVGLLAARRRALRNEVDERAADIRKPSL